MGKRFTAAFDTAKLPLLITLPSWRIEFGNLLKFMAQGRRIIGAILVGSEPPPKAGQHKKRIMEPYATGREASPTGAIRAGRETGLARLLEKVLVNLLDFEGVFDPASDVVPDHKLG